MDSFDDYDKQVRDNLRKVKLCTNVLDEVQRNLIDPYATEQQADLLLAVEELTSVSFEILTAVRSMVWHENLKPAPEDS